MPNGTGNSRNFQISGKRDNLWRLSKIFEMSSQKRSVPFDFVPEYPEILAQWIAPYLFPKIIQNLQNIAKHRVFGLLRRERDIRIKPKFSGGKNRLQVYPRLETYLTKRLTRSAHPQRPRGSKSGRKEVLFAKGI